MLRIPVINDKKDFEALQLKQTFNPKYKAFYTSLTKEYTTGN